MENTGAGSGRMVELVFCVIEGVSGWVSAKRLRGGPLEVEDICFADITSSNFLVDSWLKFSMGVAFPIICTTGAVSDELSLKSTHICDV